VPPYRRPDWVFLRALGLVYLVAFVSAWVQIQGLVGPRGVMPSGFGAGTLHAVCAGGTALAAALLVDVAPFACVLGLWMLYLAVVHLGGIFFWYQWDSLLLEAGLLAIGLAPRRLRPARAGRPDAEPAAAALWLLRWLVFRLMFGSGFEKLAHGGPLWTDLRALEVHYETQPLPSWIAWYAHHLPVWIHRLSAAGMFFVELIVPFLVFAPWRRVRAGAAAAFVLLMVGIGLTGSYGFFNILTIALCIPLLADAPLPRRAGAIAATLVVALLPVVRLQALEPLRSFNQYALFVNMTTRRPEIVIEGSDDGETWREHGFRWKPGDPARRPPFVAPHMPRLDWQLWFAALEGPLDNGWVVVLLERIQQRSPDVMALLGTDPFPAKPPRYLLARLYLYRFATPGERRATGAWWVRTPGPMYTPVISAD
jgi:hypothetical protein